MIAFLCRTASFFRGVKVDARDAFRDLLTVLICIIGRLWSECREMEVNENSFLYLS
jgi:hypothetical protein